MNIYKVVLLAVVLGAVFGFWIIRAAADELKAGKKWFKALFILGILGIFVFWVIGESAAAVTCLAVAVVAGISLGKKLIKTKFPH